MLHQQELTSELMIKDPAIKLFGKTIALPPDKAASVSAGPDVLEQKQSSSASQDSKDVSGGEMIWSKQDDDSINDVVSVENDSLSQKSPGKDEPVESKGSQEKTLSKPDKVLPCPRCNSMDTKFCYYNNYNVGQPRHFCKKCQRYWTAGGTMRNVPIGSGRRKNKHVSVPNYRHIMVSDALQNGMQFSSWKPNGILFFGSDRKFPESVPSTLSPVETSQNRSGSDFYDPPVVSSGVTSISTIKGSDANVQESGFTNPSWLQNSPTAFVPSCFPVTFYPAAPYWGCAVPSPWNMPLVSPQSSSSDFSSLSTSPSSSTLGKHSIDGSMLRPSNSQKEEFSEKKVADRRVLIPKTLRIDDPNEAAKSSVWSTLGIKNQKINPVSGTSFFKSFHSKGGMDDNMNNSSLVLQANPAALSRALNFREAAKCD